VKQAADNTINNYFSSANKIKWELKSIIDPAAIDIPDVVFPAALAAQWTGLDQEVRHTVVNDVRQHSSARSCEQYKIMILRAGFKSAIKAKILGANLTVPADITDLALKTETLEGEKKSKTNGNGFQINPVDKDEDIDVLKFGNNRAGYTRCFRGGLSQYRGGEPGRYQPNRDGYDSLSRRWIIQS
jgi:hypothetical protein